MSSLWGVNTAIKAVLSEKEGGIKFLVANINCKLHPVSKHIL